MLGGMSQIAHRFRPFGTSIFAEMSALAAAHKAVNLAQGFPDFDGPEVATHGAVEAIRAGKGQYAPMTGVPPLREAVAAAWQRDGRGSIDPEAHVTVTSGCSEGLVAAYLGLLNPGDEVVIFEPYFDFYVTCAAMAGATPRFVRLNPPSSSTGAFTFDEGELRRAFTSRTRAVVVNTPHNPTGKVFSREELSLIADLAQRHHAVVITDEVYEYLTYEAARPHISIATLPGMWERTITLSSLGKTFSLTGWKVGWAVAPEPLSACVRAAHQFLTFCAATPLQHGAAAAIREPGDYPAHLRALYAANRDLLAAALTRAGLTVYPSHGTYFLMADHAALGFADDRAFCTHLTAKVGVAAIPPSVFYHDPAAGKRLARFAFCKKRETIDEAVRRLETLRT
ncbi:MAG: aminotransferase [Phycisphaerae bacterium]|nr:MAG: aminotransferase [Phycisphaerae bacterium]